MEHVIEFGLFFGKVMIIFVAVAGLILLIFGLAVRDVSQVSIQRLLHLGGGIRLHLDQHGGGGRCGSGPLRTGRIRLGIHLVRLIPLINSIDGLEHGDMHYRHDACSTRCPKWWRRYGDIALDDGYRLFIPVGAC